VMPVAMEKLMTREASDDRVPVAGMASFGGVADNSGMNRCGAGSDREAGTVTRSCSEALKAEVTAVEAALAPEPVLTA
jgi:hypothetical protein